MKEYGFGVDVGGTTCKLGFFKTDGTLLDKWEIVTDTSNNGANILKDITDAIYEKMAENNITKDDVQGIGVGVPGAVTPDGVVNRCVNLGWGVVPIEKDLAEISGMKVRAANDANIAALGEAWMGGGKGCDSVVMVTLGTGIGGGIVINNQIITGHHGAAGEIGHIVVNPDEILECNCGNHGCIEQYASATGIVRLAKRHMDRSQKASPIRDIADLTAKDVFDYAKKKDELSVEIVETVCGLLGKLIAKICNVVNPEIVLIGGGVSKAGNIIIENMMEDFTSEVFHASKDTKIALATLGNDAGIYGGLRLILD
ncbi:MAG: ROK family glucokinase [Lachnospiraceae bacterium]|nr:ROK family glucokinase [Lachnospiraceae bacterium]MBQ1472695.1 ROK family glucokinase [Lachnospiraceae bacterium]MBQ1609127.1 ROK family glucokinase [Lachnospiraceae bacterium]MBQ1641166.1 ROK family glucokinase [Lachnospiraceae bacterium]MBQ1722061.1 ROK family glucokinase [Lachnospiraceae bacterium]